MSAISGGGGVYGATNESSMELGSARKNQRDRTTVRIRTKGSNNYTYEEGSFAHPLYSVKNETARRNAHATL